VIPEALAPHENDDTADAATKGPYSIMIDESTKMDGYKAVAILLRVVKPQSGLVENRFLDMPMCNIATADNLFSVLEDSVR